jgi:hypothetical protein
MSKFPEVDQAEIKREIFNLVNKREIEFLQQTQILSQCVQCRNQQALSLLHFNLSAQVIPTSCTIQ